MSQPPQQRAATGWLPVRDNKVLPVQDKAGTDAEPRHEVVDEKQCQLAKFTVPLIEIVRAAKTVIALRSTVLLIFHLILLFFTAYNMRPDEGMMKSAVSGRASESDSQPSRLGRGGCTKLKRVPERSRMGLRGTHARDRHMLGEGGSLEGVGGPVAGATAVLHSSNPLSSDPHAGLIPLLPSPFQVNRRFDQQSILDASSKTLMQTSWKDPSTWQESAGYVLHFYEAAAQESDDKWVLLS